MKHHLLVLFNLIAILANLARVKLYIFLFTHRILSHLFIWYIAMRGEWHQLHRMLITNILSPLLMTIVISHGFTFFIPKTRYFFFKIFMHIFRLNFPLISKSFVLTIEVSTHLIWFGISYKILALFINDLVLQYLNKIRLLKEKTVTFLMWFIFFS